MPPIPFQPELTESELEDRRQRVLNLRLRRMSFKAIGSVVNASEATVSRDWAWIQANWRDRFGAVPKFDPAEEVGEALALYREIEVTALLETTRMNEQISARKISPMFAARQKMACLRTAMTARQNRVDLLQDLGIIDRALGTLTVTLANADEIRSRMLAVGSVSPQMLVSDGERAWLNDLPVIDAEPVDLHEGLGLS